MLQITEEQAESIVQCLEDSLDRLEKDFEEIDKLLIFIVDNEVWSLLGFLSLPDMFIKRKLERFKIPTDVRDRVITHMKIKSPGLTQREIAGFLGISQSTVRRALTPTEKGGFESNDSTPTETGGFDGVTNVTEAKAAPTLSNPEESEAKPPTETPNPKDNTNPTEESNPKTSSEEIVDAEIMEEHVKLHPECPGCVCE